MTRWLVRARISPWVAPGALLAAALALYPSLGQPASPLVTGMGGLACALFVAAQVLPLPGAQAWSLGMLAIEYVISLELRGPTLDVAAPGYAAAFFLCAELGWLGLEARRGGRLWLGRAVAVGVLALAGAALGTLLLLLAAVPLPGGAAVTGLGVAAAVGVAAWLAWLAQR